MGTSENPSSTSRTNISLQQALIRLGSMRHPDRRMGSWRLKYGALVSTRRKPFTRGGRRADGSAVLPPLLSEHWYLLVPEITHIPIFGPAVTGTRTRMVSTYPKASLNRSSRTI